MHVAILGVKEIPGIMGADRVVERLLDHLPSEDTYCVYVTKGSAPHSSRSNVRFVEVAALRGKHLRAFSFFLLSSLHVALRGRRYDVAHVHNSDFGLFCLPLRLRRGLRIVGTFHGDPYLRDKWSLPARAFLRVSEWCFTHACHVLTTVAHGKTAGPREVLVIPNGADGVAVDSHSADALQASYGLEPGSYLVFACGRLDATKGLHHLIEGFREVETDKRLFAIGDFTHDERYSDAVAAAAAEDGRIVLHRHLLPREALLGMVANSAAFVFPSEVEAMSMMLLEASQCRVPVVCSDIPENVAVMGADHPLLFHSRDPHSLARALERALDRAATGQDVDVVAARVATRFRWDTAASRYAQVYRSLAAPRIQVDCRQCRA